MSYTAERLDKEIRAIDALENLIEYVKDDIVQQFFRDRMEHWQEELHDYRDETRELAAANKQHEGKPSS